MQKVKCLAQYDEFRAGLLQDFLHANEFVYTHPASVSCAPIKVDRVLFTNPTSLKHSEIRRTFKPRPSALWGGISAPSCSRTEMRDPIQVFLL